MPTMQFIINQKIKFRASFRPFAPVVLEEYTQEYFDLKVQSPYMLFTAQVSSKQQAKREWPLATGFDSLNQIKTTIPSTDPCRQFSKGANR
ncbi:MAG: hypothetical protein EOP42_07595 [Sphingobacteriaceae bacterium]|nr:MAG: hypothetical protein EOP42_07595 [Sphingobacteriaceae bacterium]